MKHLRILFLAFGALFACAAFAHVSLEQPRAEAGTSYQAVFRVGHGCDSAATTALTVKLPREFANARAEPKPGWAVTSTRDAVTWTADATSSLPSNARGTFALNGTLPREPAALWFTVTQSCAGESITWGQVPASGTSTEGLKTPAVLLQVMAAKDLQAARALPQVQGAWIRATVPGQQASGAFMRIVASEPMQLVGAATPVAGVAEVHEMKMEGEVMRMRAVDKLALPAGQAVELKPGGYHLMLQELKQPLQAGSTVPLTLVLRDAHGTQSRLELQVPVLAQAPGLQGGAASPAGHKH